MILNYHNLPGKYLSYHTHTKKDVLYLFPALFVEKSNIQIMVNQWRQSSWIYGKLVYFHQSDFRGFYICFSFVNSELFGALYSGHSVNFNRFGNFFNYNIFFFFLLFTIYNVIHSYIQLTFSLYEIKININSIINFAYFDKLWLAHSFKTRLIHHNVHIKFKICSSVLQCEYFSVRRIIW